MAKIALDDEMKKLALKYGAAHLYNEAECVEEYEEWLTMELMGYGDDVLRAMAEYAEAHGKN